MKQKKFAFLTNWSIVLYPEIIIAWTFSNRGFRCIIPDSVFSGLTSSRQISLFGNAVNDSRENIETGEFATGHRIITTPIIEAIGGLIITENTIYVLGEVDERYRLWCMEHSVDVK